MARVTGVSAHDDGSFFCERLVHSRLLISCAPARPPGYVIKARHTSTFRRALVSLVHAPHQSLSSCLRVSPSYFSARTESWESRTPEPPSVKQHLLGCAGDQSFGERLRDCSLLQIIFVFFLVAVDIIFFFFVFRIVVFFLVDVRGTTLRTPSCINCGPRLQATHYGDQCDQSHRCLEHGSLRRV